MKRVILLSFLISVASIAAYGQTCDQSLLQHVYKPERLIVKTPCIEVTGTIVDATANQSKHQPNGTRHEQDGDTHGWLKLDPQFQNLVNAGNVSDEGGNLVFEIVCKFPVKQTDAKAACLGFQNSVQIPPLGSHVRIVGRAREKPQEVDGDSSCHVDYGHSLIEIVT